MPLKTTQDLFNFHMDLLANSYENLYMLHKKTVNDNYDIWTKTDISKFHTNLHKYEQSLKNLKNLLASQYQWKSQQLKQSFYTLLIDTEKSNNQLLYIIKQRLSLYEKFNNNKNKLIKQLNQLYNNIDIDYYISKYNTQTLNTLELEFNNLKTDFTTYINYRKALYTIFNILTDESNIKDTKITNIFCSGEIDINILNTLYNKAVISQNKSALYENRFYGLFPNDVFHDKSTIKKIHMIPTNANQCKILSDGQYIYSAVKMYNGDIIEICPTKIIDKTSLYTKDMRDIVFEVIPNEKYVIPFGYCQYYAIADKTHPANCEYTWDEDKKIIVIRAIKHIQPNEKLYLNIVK